MTEDQNVIVPDWLDVSRETFGLLEDFARLVRKWTPAINLISKGSIVDVWNRHLFDSAQLYSLVPQGARHLADLGSGGGFPGIVLAILAKEKQPELHVTLVEADRRKATFLSEAVRQLSLNCTVVAERIEALAPLAADVLTARAVAPLTVLCAYAERHLAPDGLALFAKGARVEAELLDARQTWTFELTEVASKSDDAATIVVLRDIRHV